MSKIKLPGDLIPSKSPLPGLQISAFLLYPHIVERESPGVSSYTSRDPITGASPS